MILVDTSVWIDHLRAQDADLTSCLESGIVLGHTAVLAEIALGQLSNRTVILGLLGALPAAKEATHRETVIFVETRHLYGRGIGYVDAQLLASTALTPNATLWTRDKKLRSAADELRLARSN